MLEKRRPKWRMSGRLTAAIQLELEMVDEIWELMETEEQQKSEELRWLLMRALDVAEEMRE